MAAVMLIGIAAIITRANGPGGEIEAYFADEIDNLRGDLRADMTHAAKSTHRALTDKIKGFPASAP